MWNVSQEALVESRTLRDSFTKQQKASLVLEKVKALTLLPDDLNVTVEMAAEYYEVGIEAIKSLIKDHREELEADGLRVIEGRELELFAGSLKDLTNFEVISPMARSLTVIPRRALLRIGMLLRVSEVAKQVRTALLDTEAEARQFTWVKVAREVDAVARMYRLSGKPKQEAFRLAVLRVQEQTGTDLTEFLPEASPIVDIVDLAIRNGAIRANPQSHIGRQELQDFFTSYAVQHHYPKIASNQLINRLTEVGVPLICRRMGPQRSRKWIWIGIEVLDRGLH